MSAALNSRTLRALSKALSSKESLDYLAGAKHEPCFPEK